MENLEHLLKTRGTQRPQFSDKFTASVMAKIKDLGSQQVRVVMMWQSRIWKIAAACFVGCLLSIYALDGNLTVDSVLGLSEYSDVEISQSYQTYSVWDGEY